MAWWKFWEDDKPKKGKASENNNGVAGAIAKLNNKITEMESAFAANKSDIEIIKNDIIEIREMFDMLNDRITVLETVETPTEKV
jgi:hypothetical protein